MATPADQLADALETAARGDYRPMNTPAAQAIADATAELRSALALVLLTRATRSVGLLRGIMTAFSPAEQRVTTVRIEMLDWLLRRDVDWSEEQAVAAADALGGASAAKLPVGRPFAAIERTIVRAGRTPELLAALQRLQEKLAQTDKLDVGTHRALQRIASLLGQPPFVPESVAVDSWEWQACIDSALATLSPAQNDAWRVLFQHAYDAQGNAKPGVRWAKRAAAMVAALPQFATQLAVWINQAQIGRAGFTSNDEELLKGLVWAAASVGDEGLARSIGTLADRCFKKVAGQGALSTKLGNACLVALGAMPDGAGVAQLTRLRGKVRYAAARRILERSVDGAAARMGQTREDLEELAVPHGGLDREGSLRIAVADHHAELAVVDGIHVRTTWIRPDGKRQGGVPAELKRAEPGAVLHVRKEADSLKGLLEGQAARIEHHWLSDRRLPVAALRERYLEHPLVSHVARRLLWRVGDADAMWDRSLPDEGEARLWHPLDGTPQDDVIVWRDLFEQRGLRQPFQQLSREIYRPLDPEGRRDARFRGQLVRQQAFLPAVKQRGWQYRIQGYWDSANLPTLTLPGPGHGYIFTLQLDPVAHSSDNGIFRYLATADLICNHAFGDVPPILLSEVLRGLDLAISGSSVVNDPSFDEHGLARDWRNWWQEALWADLGPVGRTRRDVLSRILDRTTLRESARLEDRWLIVGDVRIHLGTGQARSVGDRPMPLSPDKDARERAAAVYLPFEGDATLTTILAKAFLLAR
jgi:hypothetical protein